MRQTGAARGFEQRSMESESNMLTLTPRGQLNKVCPRALECPSTCPFAKRVRKDTAHNRGWQFSGTTLGDARAASWAEARVKIARVTLTIKLDGNWSSFQLANSAPPLSVTDSAIAPSARITLYWRPTFSRLAPNSCKAFLMKQHTLRWLSLCLRPCVPLFLLQQYTCANKKHTSRQQRTINVATFSPGTNSSECDHMSF